MLNEIYTLHKSLERCGIVPEKVHPWLTYHKKSDGFIVGINESGKVRRIEFQPKEKMVTTWKLMPSNQKSFPVLNLKIPIWLPNQSVEEIRTFLNGKKGVTRFNQLNSIIKDANLFPHNKDHDIDNYIAILNKRFSDFPAELQKKLKGTDLEQSAFFSLLIRIQKISGKAELFLQQLSEIIINACIEGRLESVEVVEQLLLGKWHKKKEIYETGDIPIVFDVNNYSDFECRIFDEEIKDRMSKVLLQEKKIQVTPKKCALSGIIGSLEDKKFPEPKLPILGKSYLFSMNKDAGCHYRYGKVSAGNYPVNSDLANDLQDSLLYITSPDRKGQTWCSVPSSDKKESNLLISYLENMPISEIDLSFLSETGGTEADFEAAAKVVCDALKGNKAITPDDQLRIFVLKSVDKGRRQVLFNSTFPVSSILNGIEIWQKGAKNHPSFSLVVPLKKGEKARALNPFCPSPSGVMRLFHYQWIRNGLDNTAVQGCRLNDVYDLFFGSTEKNKKLYTRFLKTLLRQTCPLLLGIGEALNTKTIKIYSIDAKKTTLLAIGFLAILLDKLGHKKEEYMKNEAFQIGRILSLADTLHKEYGKVVRKDIPTQLLGNAMMKIALDNPQRALARLNQRLLIYKAWADKGGEEAKLAKWAVSEMGGISRKLEESDLGFRPDEAAQAKMLLGYLARNAKKDNNKQGETK
jgi:hypothetical protein